MELTAVDNRLKAALDELVREGVLEWEPLSGGNVQVDLFHITPEEQAAAFQAVSAPARRLWWTLRELERAANDAEVVN